MYGIKKFKSYTNIIIIDSGCQTINLNDESCFEEMNLNDFDIREVRSTCMIETFMNTHGYKKTYRHFIGNTYYEFVQDELLDDQLEVLLLYTVCQFNKI